MGQTLTEPVTAKESSSASNSYLKVGSSCMQGWRVSILFLCYDVLVLIVMTVGLSSPFCQGDYLTH